MDMFDKRGASPMLIGQQMNAFDDSNWIYELKLDGFRCLAYVDDTMVEFRNKRNMEMLAKFPELKDIYKQVNKKCILDGEIVVLKEGVPDFYRLQKRTMLTDPFKIEMESKRYPASYVVFDCIYVEEKELIWEPLMERKGILSHLIKENERLAVSRYIEGRGIALYQAADESELEGVVAKRKDSIYQMGKRTKDWIKFKRMADEDFVVAGYVPKENNMFSLVLAKHSDGILMFKGYVTAGVSREAIGQLNISRENPFFLHPVIDEEVVWVKPERVCVVEYMPNLKNALRQPVFKGFRDDVDVEEV